MGWFEDINRTVSAGGQWLGDHAGVGPSASTSHRAEAEAHTDQPATDTGNFMQSVGDLGRGIQQEGLSGLLDPFGAVDRQDAQRDLASRFNVGGTPDGAQNSVGEAEFQRIARTYSDIRRGRGNLTLNTDGMSAAQAAEFRARTMDDVGDILQTDVGRNMIGDLQVGALDADHETHRMTRIGQANNVNDARGGGRWDDASEHKRGHANYIPGATHLPGAGDYRSDVVLFHELTHAYQSTHDNFAPGQVSVPSGDIDEGVDESEYQAVGLGGHAGNVYSENAYRHDRQTLGSGIRTLGGDDHDLTEREHYNVPGAGTHDHGP